MKLWLVAYDIRDPKRLRKVWNTLRRWGEPVQYSVFECWLTEGQVEKLWKELGEVIETDEDRVHLWPLCARCEARVRVMGTGGRTAPLPGAIVLTSEEDFDDSS